MLAQPRMPEPIARASVMTVGVKLFLALCDDWGLSETERMTLAGLTSRNTLRNWKERAESGDPVKLRPDTLERLSLIAGIRKSIEILLPRAEWSPYIRRPNRDFAGHSALERMLGGRVIDLWEVRRYLDMQRGASFA
ncbi:MAG: antitoxin Xre-like helix-turn-helix domain-containing protein [Parahaliea sp.]